MCKCEELESKCQIILSNPNAEGLDDTQIPSSIVMCKVKDGSKNRYFVSADDYPVATDPIEINFCPFCGKKLV